MAKIPEGATYQPVQKIPEGATYDTPQQPQATISRPPEFGTMPWLKSTAYTVADKATNLFPAVGGMAGGLLGLGGGPAGAIAGATIGGGGGEALRQLSRRAVGFETPQTSSDAAESIGGEGLRQGAYEAGGQLFGRVGKAIAPKLAEASVAPGKRMLKSLPEGVDIGKTILDETSSYRPKALVKELDTKIGDASNQVDALANGASQSGKTMSLYPARDAVAKEIEVAKAKNSPSYLRDVNKVNDQLHTQFDLGGQPKMTRPNITVNQPSPILDEFGQPVQSQVAAKGAPVPVQIPPAVDPVRGRAIKQGIDTEIGNWNPEAQSAIAPLQERVRGLVNNEFHNAVPGAAPLDKQMTSLIPTRDAAWNTSFNPGVTRSVLERFARPTGALVGAGLGAKEGYDIGGTPGAIAGGVSGLVVPNLITSPGSMLFGARALNSRVPSSILRYSVPLAESQRKRDLDPVSEFRQKLQQIKK